MSACVILVAAGHGRRFGLPKQFKPLLGRPLLYWPLRAFERCSVVASVVLVVARERLAWARSFVRKAGLRKVFAVVEGGAERSGSARRGVAAAPREADILLIHDAARALVTPDIVSRVAEAAARTGAALAAWPVPDTLKAVKSERRKTKNGRPFVSRTVPREGLWQAQTPQGFRRALADKLYRRSPGKGVTDDVQLAERAGLPVEMVPGAPTNFKVTLPQDFKLCEAVMKAASSEYRASGRGGRKV